VTRAIVKLAYCSLLLVVLPLPIAASAHAQLAHKGPAAAIALSKTLAPFDVSSVRQNDTVEVKSWNISIHEDDVTANDVPLKELIQFAYDVKGDLITGLDGPVASANFDLMAKVLPSDSGPPAKLTEQQLQAMIIPMLAERFHLKAHVEPKILPVYDLVVAKSGPKFKLDPSESDSGSWNMNGENTEKMLSSKDARMEDLAAALSDETDRQVIDKTGLTGHADITLKWSDDVAATQGGANVISIFTAVEEQLGLKLQPSKGSVDTLVIDHAEMPSEN
jgi:bla regulator protein BlaR1